MQVNQATKTLLEKVHERIRPYIHKTNVLTSNYFNKISGASLYFKCENFQKTGSFKIRGVMNSILSLNDDEMRNGVAAHSSGNHAQALAYGAKIMKIPAYLIMPENSAKKKVSAVREYNGNIYFCEANDDARALKLREVILETHAHPIHAYDAIGTIQGQSSAAKELIEELKSPPDIIIAPVGGGGLLSGTALAAKLFSPGTKVYGAEPELARDAFESFREGKIIKRDNGRTMADGLRTNLGKLNFEIITHHVEQILLVSEQEIAETMYQVWERMKIIIEPSAAVPLAAILKNKEKFRGKRIGILFTGGNVDLGEYPVGQILNKSSLN